MVMVQVLLSREGQADIDALDPSVHIRIIAGLKRLANWPNVSGVKPLRGEWAGHWRLRVADWRIIFQEIRPDVIVVRIKHRSEVYDE